MKTIWKTITIKNITLEVSNTQQIRYDNKIYKQLKTFYGYSIVQLRINRKYTNIPVHRAVATAFIPNPLQLETVNHKNGIKTDNDISNLEWLSISDNLKHAHRTGLIKNSTMGLTGSKNQNSKLTDNQALYIYISPEPTKILAAKYNISKSTVFAIKAKTRWQHLTKDI